MTELQTLPGWTVENWSHHKVDSLTCIKNEIEEREDGPGTGGRAPGRGRGSAAHPRTGPTPESCGVSGSLVLLLR